MSWLKSSTCASLAGGSVATALAQTLTLTLDHVIPAVASDGQTGPLSRNDAVRCA